MPDEQLEDRRINYERRADQERLQVCYVVMDEEKYAHPYLSAVFLSVEDALNFADARNETRRLILGESNPEAADREWVVYERDFGANPREDRRIS